MNKHKKRLENIIIIGASLALAFVINTVVGTGALNATLKASILDTKTEITTSDVFLERESDVSDVVKLKTGKTMENVKGLAFSLIYNPEDVEIKDIYSPEKKVNILKTSSNPGIVTVYLTLDEDRTINSYEDILGIVTEKKSDKEVSLSLLNANFQDKKDNKLYELTTKWLQY